MPPAVGVGSAVRTAFPVATRQRAAQRTLLVTCSHFCIVAVASILQYISLLMDGGLACSNEPEVEKQTGDCFA